MRRKAGLAIIFQVPLSEGISTVSIIGSKLQEEFHTVLASAARELKRDVEWVVKTPGKKWTTLMSVNEETTYLHSRGAQSSCSRIPKFKRKLLKSDHYQRLGASLLLFAFGLWHLLN